MIYYYSYHYLPYLLTCGTGLGNNSILLQHINVSDHEASHSSPISISSDSTPQVSDVQLKDVRFRGNRRQRTRGAALSIFARFSRQSAPHFNVTLYDCSFTNNSVIDSQVAGAMYIANVASVRFDFQINLYREQCWINA